MWCGEVLVPGLLFADDTTLMAESDEEMKKSLQCLQSWCEKWSVEINVGKSAGMHMRKRGVDRCSSIFQIGEDVIPMVSTYKYLGCMVDEFLECSSMVEHRVQLGSQALCVWLRRCQEFVGEVSGKSFMQLMKSLVDPVFMYGAEIWGCHQKFEGLSQIQLWALHIFFGVSGCLAPKTFPDDGG